jgi:YidC/Oxa1 family membrane protein insertase
LALGYELIIRPHPHFYERDQITMAMLREIAADSGGKVTIENPDKEFNSFWLADIMISDWSGVAFEFAFATGRPVVFVDAPRKVNSVELASLDLPIMEKEARSEVGVVVGSIDTLSDGIEEAFSYSAADWVDRIAKARVKYVFNFGDSAEAGSRVLKEIGAGAEMLPHSDVTRERLAELIEFYSHPLRDRDDLARHPIS